MKFGPENSQFWGCWSKNQYFGYFWAQISPILVLGESKSLQNLPKCVKYLHNRTYLTITNRLGGYMYIFGTRFSGFWSSSPKIGYFPAQISPILAPGGSQNLQNLPKFVNSLHNQTYLTITNRLGSHSYNFGTLFSDFWSSSPKIGYFWAQISPILAPGGSQSLQNLQKFKFSGRIS